MLVFENLLYNGKRLCYKIFCTSFEKNNVQFFKFQQNDVQIAHCTPLIRTLAYRELRESGALVLPSERVLRDYKNYFKPKAGINLENIESLREKAATLTGIQRYLVLVMDEMKIQSNLVFDKHSGELIGFVDLGDPMMNYASLGEEDVMATHALAFLVRGMCSDLKHVIAYYFTENVTSY